MKLIKPSYNIIEQEGGLNGIYKQIELAGRTCYKSEDKITEDSAKGFVDRMIKSGHGAMLEHGTVYLRQDLSLLELAEVISKGSIPELLNKYDANTHSVSGGGRLFDENVFSIIVTTNLRVLVENNWLDDLKYLCEPTEFHEKRVTVRFICDRGVSHEFVRHRVFSFAQESTRYCNYSKDKFNNEITFIIPEWCPEIREDSNKGWDPCSMYDKFYLQHLQAAEDTYFSLLKQWNEKIPDKRYKSGFRNNPWTPQQARAVLPNSLKTELVMTGFIKDWKHFFFLRDAAPAHPQARELAEPLHKEFIEKGYIAK